MNNYLLLLGLTIVSLAPVSSATEAWRQIMLRDFCVTEGRVTESSPGNFVIQDPRARAVLGFATPQTAELSFRYLGPTAVLVPLESGIVRTQIGLKLRAEDGCNLVYAMWRIAPVSQIVVSIKNNPGQHTFAECQNRGYHNITAEKSISIAAPKIGNAHSMRAEIIGTQLTVNIDGQLAWQGVLDASAFTFNGPVGFRSDNGQFDAQYFAYQPDIPTMACPNSGPE
ncbi:MAG TPA: hypothetical protein VHS29_13530 [Candidatus Acidoferrales bacterium]|jgi:hypothetical protein|nr:hypothetical protein [Candidatus Acidoferrales bacterium]